MLRLSAKDCEDIAGFQALSQTAAQQNFGRLFRSPDVWEDMVKSILLCNCGCALGQILFIGPLRPPLPSRPPLRPCAVGE